MRKFILRGPEYETALNMEALPRDTVDHAPAAHELLIVASEIECFFPPDLLLYLPQDLNC